MDYGVSDSSGTDDDLPPTHRGRYQKGPRATANMRSAIVGPGPLPAMHGDMETQIHLIEQEAYYSLIRAFKAQSDTISWEMESLITELRKELRVSDDEHSKILSRVNADETIRRIREWRKSNGHQPVIINTSQPILDFAPSPTVSASRKKQKTSQSTAPLPMVAPPPIMHPPMPPSSGTLRRGPPPGAKTKRPKTSMQHPSAGVTGRIMGANQRTLGEPAAALTYDPLPLIGKKVWTRWPDDNNFYEAVITDYNPAEGRHALVYDSNTADEAWEWVNLKEISPDDIRWEGEDPGALSRKGRLGPGRGVKKNMGRGGGGPSSGRGRGTTKGGGSKKEVPISQNGVGRKVTGKIQILHTDTLIKEVESVIASSKPDPADIERAKKILKEHEEALVDAIAKLEDVSDGESDGKEPPRAP